MHEASLNHHRLVSVVEMEVLHQQRLALQETMALRQCLELATCLPTAGVPLRRDHHRFPVHQRPTLPPCLDHQVRAWQLQGSPQASLRPRWLKRTRSHWSTDFCRSRKSCMRPSSRNRQNSSLHNSWSSRKCNDIRWSTPMQQRWPRLRVRLHRVIFRHLFITITTIRRLGATMARYHPEDNSKDTWLDTAKDIRQRRSEEWLLWRPWLPQAGKIM
ncbi:hypothetical protein BC939DRAFT_244061 [Gamsiella multidivaricata]|uniref:uncharacterized protein n=1 Tax=Gamsiella multidivaricata TaxID=101098 RepID=UPI0022209845|nr:uncharacterized protein BC939DRAFT_244061 [Gamsiella multidivaricata]KAI7820025.1 hypothetical protein BC939DRAFT_244061 [Gamsiella multidivaricata]